MNPFACTKQQIQSIYKLIDRKTSQHTSQWTSVAQCVTLEEVQKPIQVFMTRTQSTTEKLDIAIEYIRQIKSGSKIEFTQGTWYRMTMVALMLACKMTDDIVLAFEDFAQCIKGMSCQLLQLLEKEFLESLQFNCFVELSAISVETHEDYDEYDQMDKELRDILNL
ncbi:Cyclin [Hexamita inflata]|uniref:Cyclin n=1 Tax=Hexamita inflata TaxID=28002 RepID=A0AA86QRZ4_9EUKA|nr:Cyclin [Hexamita inflata]CAI9944225.1 Cyclin [Hexamita inflata]CAI9963540.1 Cyclin [Hexamita inflata]CAI9963544.1 Cyclin [Hexamita inflata]